MELGDVPKRQEPDYRTDNSRISPIGQYAARNSRNQRRPSAGPKQISILLQ